ncbi:VanZ family protein [Lentzea sp. NPDC004782]|uniref:VanZ family protein n=1 Tax=Lentzea sp. NPDC004782 TaxID=3154458 RepID=UPI00339FFCC4
MLDTWQEWVGTETGVVALSVLSLPAAALAAGLLGRRRRMRGVPAPWRTTLAEVGLIYGTVPWVPLTLLPGEREAHGTVILVPFTDLVTMDRGQIIGNLLLFAALGFFAPLRFPVLASLGRVVALAAACSTLIEVLQYVLLLDRVSSVDDVLLNTTGAGLAALLSYRWWRSPAPSALTGPDRLQRLGPR